MQLLIDNLDGHGATDYSAAIDRSAAFAIERTLNAPSLARGMLSLGGSALAVPARQARVAVSSDAGTTLFTGYLATEPVAIYAGVASEGSVFRYAFSAVSDEWLLDKQAAGIAAGTALGTPAGQILQRLTEGVDASRVSPAGLAGGRSVGVFEPAPGTSWSAHAGAVADASYAAYRALNGALNLNPAGGVVHALSEGDGTLSVAALHTSAARELANDVTVSGAIEPTVFWTELFLGDGTTAVFNLSGEPAAPPAGHATLIDEPFTGTSLDRARWAVADPGSHLSLSGGLAGTGFALNGGNGFDGQTTLTAWDGVEIGGTVVVELGNVTLGAASAGFLAGLYAGPTAVANLFAGFSIAQSGGNTILSPVVNGALSGTPFTLLSGHSYTLRMRLHCPELQRTKQSFYALVAGAVEQFGGGLVDAPVALVFEVRDAGSSSNTPVTVLLDTALITAPAYATFVPVNSVQLFGSIGSVHLTRTGTAWIATTDPTTGTVSTRLAGKAGDGVDCTVSGSVTGHVTFFSGRVPVPNATVTARYRGRDRAVARLADAASIAREAQGGAIGTARWLGKVLRPVARSSEDCENAAAAILSFSTDRAAAVSGKYVTVNPSAAGSADIWPGDVLALASSGAVLNVIVRKVAIEEQGAAPEALTYKIAFANDWAEGLGIKLSEAIAPDAPLPQIAQPGLPAPVPANLQQLTVNAWTSTAGSASLTVDAGADPPAGGGFEVRRRDGGFGSGVAGSGSGDLVLRSPVRGFSIPRGSFEETFYVRLYDASIPPKYSRWSSAIATHLPID